MGSGLAQRLGDFIAGRAILLLLIAAFFTVTLIGVAGMSLSVVVAETVQGSGSAINVAGSLRRLTHRVGSLVVAEALGGGIGRDEVIDAVGQFESTLVHPALAKVLDRNRSGVPAAIYRGVVSSWHDAIKPRLLGLTGQAVEPPAPARYEKALREVDDFVEQINALVAVLEHEAEAKISQLRTILAVALALTVAVVLAAVYLLRARLLLPLAALRAAAGRIARRDFTVRSEHTGRDELGRVGEAFNTMAAELSGAYADLEQRVAEKTADLTRSNRSLELLYQLITRLYHAPASAESYAEILTEIERIFGLEGSFACVQSKHGGPASILHANIASCSEAERDAEQVCLHCPGRAAPWTYRRDGGCDILMVPLRDAENLYGMLRLALPAGRRLESWQKTLIEAVSRHMGIALGISRQTERERLIALQEERSTIARELHDSLAQSLSYMKIQVSLLQPVLADPARREEALAVLGDLREGITSAYRQLRELLSSFRLRMEGDFSSLLRATVEEFSSRGGIPIDVDTRLAGCSLTANQEIHVLHIIREALSNATRHSAAERILVALACGVDDVVSVVIDDDGRGIDPGAAVEHHHYGVAIMGERARGLGGELAIGPRPGGGTRVSVRFNPHKMAALDTIDSATAPS
ncbi:MAG TPA: histidine kinase [Rhodocyclaceae bacterium]|nr:histidine kinase [Rhodocyclaceae bacterium]